jgi:hypothetical protein
MPSRNDKKNSDFFCSGSTCSSNSNRSIDEQLGLGQSGRSGLREEREREKERERDREMGKHLF